MVVAILLGSCRDAERVSLSGYVEIEPVRLGAALSGRLISLPLTKGQTVHPGQTAFVLEQEQESLSVAEAEAHLSQAQSQLKNLLTGKRPVEIEAIAAELLALQTALNQSDADWKRQVSLHKQGLVSDASLDLARTKRDVDAARVEQLKAQLAAAKLPAREAEIEATRASAVAAKQQLAMRQWGLQQKSISIPVGGQIDDTYFRPGEWVPSGSPVISILPPGALKIRFFIPENERSRYVVGSQILVQCDHCGSAQRARISSVAKEAEFTPPVLYNRDNRSRLVWMAEAEPLDRGRFDLRPGQPVDVVISP